MFYGILVLLLLGLVARGELIVSSHNNGRVLRFDHESGAFLGTIASGLPISAPHELVFAHDRQLYVASANNDLIHRFSPTNSGTFLGSLTNSSPLNYPAGMTVGPDGLLYVSSQLSDSILRYIPTNGVFVDTFVTNGSGGLDGPSGIVFGPEGDLFVVGRYSHRVYRYNGTNGAFISVFVTNNLAQPFGCRFGPDGHLYVVNGNSNNVVRCNGTNGAFMGTFATGLNFPVGLIFGPDTNLYVANFGGNTVVKFNGLTGAFITNVVTNAAGGVSGPNFLTFRPDVKPAPISSAEVAGFDGTNYLTISVSKGTNTGPVWIYPEVAEELSGSWQGGTNVVVLEDSVQLFRARDALPLGAATNRHLRVRFAQP